MTTARLELENGFWRFSLAVYAAPGVAEECLALQDEFGADINLLLFCAWAGTKRAGVLGDADIAGAEAAVVNWRNDVVRPLRAVRRTLKRIEGDDSGLRSKVKTVELAAEQVEQAMLYSYAGSRWPESRPAAGADTVAENVRTYMRVVAPDRVASDENVLPKKLIEAARGLVR